MPAPRKHLPECPPVPAPRKHLPERPPVPAPRKRAPMMALALDQSQVMSPEVLSCPQEQILSVLSCHVLSVGVPQKLAASLVMATDAIPKLLTSPAASIEAVPEFSPEMAPVTTFSPRRAVGLMSSPVGTSDSEPRTEKAPVPEDSPRRALEPLISPKEFFLGGL